MLLQTSPPTDELLHRASAVNGVRCLIEGKGGVISLFIQPDRILAYKGNDSNPFGVLRFGGPHSGAIWVEGDLVAEYDKNLSGEYFIVEVEDGFLADSRRKGDPVAYLIARANA